MLRVEENKLIMPKGIRYISESGYTLEDFQFPHILDKKIPGCGYTEYCITSNLPIILCSPRKILLENKEAQHKGFVFYFKNEFEYDRRIDKDITKPSKISSVELISEAIPEISNESLEKLLNSLSDYLLFCQVKGLIPKILVTYDSFRLVKDYLIKRDLFQHFYVVIDEFQSIFTDSRFKSTTEMEFVSHLNNVSRVCFVSATPMIDKYLKQIDEFKDLPYFEIDWSSEDPNRIIKPDLKTRITNSIVSEALKIIEEYKKGNFEQATTVINNEIKIIESREVVFYVNSVNNILSIIKRAELNPDECNILCAKTQINISRIQKKLGRKWEVGSVPLKGESHKMFTFCTRTVYLGADFYSNNARTVILSDANIDCLAVDISLDLPQILGRQRLNENPWKNRAEFYYKTLGKSKELTKEEFDKRIAIKIKKSNNLLNSYSDTRQEAKHDLAENFQIVAKTLNYKNDYVSVNEHNGSDLVPCLNNLVLVAEQRAYDIQQIDYKDRFAVFSSIMSESSITSDITNNINTFLQEFFKLSDFPSKMKAICECPLSDNERFVILDQVPIQFKNFYLILGPEKCKALSYNVTLIKRACNDTLFDKSVLEQEIYNTFQVGSRYSKADIKEILKDLYAKLGYNKTPKANDLEEFFNIKLCKVGSDNGFIILSKKGENLV